MFVAISAMLRNEVGWFDIEQNSTDNLSMYLANDATFVRAAFSNRLSIFIQDGTAVVVSVLIGMLLGWRLAFVALATLPILTVSAIAQVCFILIQIVSIHFVWIVKHINGSINYSLILHNFFLKSACFRAILQKSFIYKKTCDCFS